MEDANDPSLLLLQTIRGEWYLLPLPECTPERDALQRARCEPMNIGFDTLSDACWIAPGGRVGLSEKDFRIMMSGLIRRILGRHGHPVADDVTRFTRSTESGAPTDITFSSVRSLSTRAQNRKKKLLARSKDQQLCGSSLSNVDLLSLD